MSVGELSVGEMSIGELSFGEMSGYRLGRIADLNLCKFNVVGESRAIHLRMNQDTHLRMEWLVKTVAILKKLHEDGQFTDSFAPLTFVPIRNTSFSSFTFKFDCMFWWNIIRVANVVIIVPGIIFVGIGIGCTDRSIDCVIA